MKKKDNKGFTLVELIVVLVILAILAAILVPALLGYIDEAKKKENVINAKALMTAIQSELTKTYAFYQPKNYEKATDAQKRCIFYKDKGVSDKENDVLMNDSDFTKRVLEKAGVEKPFALIFFARKLDLSLNTNITKAHECFTAYSVLYWADKDDDPLIYNFETDSWEVGNLYTCGLMKRGKDGNKVLYGKYKDQEIKHYILTYETAIDGNSVTYENFKGTGGKYVKMNDYFDANFK